MIIQEVVIMYIIVIILQLFFPFIKKFIQKQQNQL